MSNLFGRNIVVYDLEIKNVIDGENVKWSTPEKMGISVGVAFHYLTGEYKVFMDDNLPALAKLLNQAEVVSGFNIIGFDNTLLNATLAPECEKYHGKNTYDILLESRIATGWTPQKRFPSGMRLDDHLRGTFGPDFLKTADGAEAPIMYQDGRIGELVSYCIADVKRECLLFEHIWNEKPVKTEAHGEHLLRHPAQLDLIPDVLRGGAF
jgi:hypothetical protein